MNSGVCSDAPHVSESCSEALAEMNGRTLAETSGGDLAAMSGGMLAKTSNEALAEMSGRTLAETSGGALVAMSGEALVAMSGGVDSSVAALLACASGLTCTGVLLKLIKNSNDNADTAYQSPLAAYCESPLAPQILLAPSPLWQGGRGCSRHPPFSKGGEAAADADSDTADAATGAGAIAAADSCAAADAEAVTCAAADAEAVTCAAADADSDIADAATGADADFKRDCDDVRGVTAKLGMRFSVLDFSDFFAEDVISPFVMTYLRGATPNPCVLCNRRIKFGRLLDYALEHGFNYVVSGHYAQTEKDSLSGRVLLKKASDAAKDQSYMLYSLTQRQLSHVLFPLGGLSKNEVRGQAAANGFPNADRHESQDICFVKDGNYAGFIESYLRLSQHGGLTQQGGLPQLDGVTQHDVVPKQDGLPQLGGVTQHDVVPQQGGFIYDAAGGVVGRHSGALRYTIGQRRGLGVAAPEPLYVYAKSMADNAVYVGSESLLYSKSLVAGDVNLIPFDSFSGIMRVTAKVRYRQPEQSATVEMLEGGKLRVDFDSPQRAVTNGQSVVLYDGDVVIGGGIIE